jgi:PIN domain nuclease of toxin-antitoxin system
MLLLDTQVWLWTLSSPERLRADVRERIAAAEDPVFLSAASSWEIAIKYHLGKLQLPEHPREFIPARLVRDRISPLPIEHAHAVEVAGLPDHHTDPFDRMLVAQCRYEGMALVTADRLLRAYEVDLIWAA